MIDGYLSGAAPQQASGRRRLVRHSHLAAARGWLLTWLFFLLSLAPTPFVCLFDRS